MILSSVSSAMATIGKFLTECLVGPHSVRRGQIVYVNDSNLTGASADGEDARNILDSSAFARSPVIRLSVFVESLDQMFEDFRPKLARCTCENVLHHLARNSVVAVFDGSRRPRERSVS